MAEIVVRTFADVTANRAPSIKLNEDINVKVKTGAVACLRLVDGPEGCNGIHCEQKKNSCKETECLDRLQKKYGDLKTDNETSAATIKDELEYIDELLREIATYCRTDSLYYPKVEESRLVLGSALTGTTEITLCECMECQLAFQQKEKKLLKHKAAAARTRLTVMSEYRRAHDKETLARTSSNYMNGGPLFTPVGAAKAKGVRAMRPG